MSSPHPTTSAIQSFIDRWANVTASEISTSQSFIIDLCELLDVPRPHPTPERDYMFGKDLTARPRGVKVIDLFGLDADTVRQRFPAVYQWVMERVKPVLERLVDLNTRRASEEAQGTIRWLRPEFQDPARRNAAAASAHAPEQTAMELVGGANAPEAETDEAPAANPAAPNAALRPSSTLMTQDSCTSPTIPAPNSTLLEKVQQWARFTVEWSASVQTASIRDC